MSDICAKLLVMVLRHRVYIHASPLAGLRVLSAVRQ